MNDDAFGPGTGDFYAACGGRGGGRKVFGNSVLGGARKRGRELRKLEGIVNILCYLSFTITQMFNKETKVEFSCSEEENVTG